MQRQIFIYITFAIFSSLLVVGALFLVTRPPRGEAIALLPPPGPAPVIVHISGAVAQPGVYTLTADSRVQDAIQAAGGVLPEADSALLNLAAPLQDGSQLVIPTKVPTPLPAVRTSAGKAGDPESPATPATTAFGALINLNTATKETLDTLPGIGPAIALRIIDYRTTNGPFMAIEDVQNVKGIGPAIFEKIKHSITVGP